MRRVSLQPAYVLHRRAYRETSCIVDLFTPEYGRVSAIAKGVRKAKSSTQGILQPFTPLLVSWSGKSELMSLTQVDMRQSFRALHGECLFAGFYINELLLALLQKWDEHPRLYDAYENVLVKLTSHTLDQVALRSFEKLLLEDLGYGLFTNVAELEEMIDADKYYRFVPNHGFVISELGDDAKEKSTVFKGESLLAIAHENWQIADAMQDAKRLTRFLLAPLLGNRQINSRKLFMHPLKQNEEEG